MSDDGSLETAQFDRATLLFEHGRFEQAAVELRKLLAGAPDFGPASMMLALVLAYTLDASTGPGLRSATEALNAAEQGIHLEPTSGGAHYVYAMVLGKLGRLAEAESSIQEAIRLEPDNLGHKCCLVRLLVRGDRHSEALALTEKVLASDPEDEVCARVRAFALIELGRLDEARIAARYALSLFPDNADSHSAMGLVALRSGDHKNALFHFSAALRIDPSLQGARDGHILALQAGNPLYLWLSRALRLIFNLHASSLLPLAIVGWCGVHALPRLVRMHPADIPAVVVALALYFLINLFPRVARSALFLLVPTSRLLLGDSVSPLRLVWTRVDICYLTALGLLPLSVVWPALTIPSIIADCAFLISFVSIPKDATPAFAVGACIPSALMILLTMWLRG